MNRELLKNFIIELGNDSTAKNELLEKFKKELSKNKDISGLLEDLNNYKIYLLDFIKSFELDEKKAKRFTDDLMYIFIEIAVSKLNLIDTSFIKEKWIKKF